MLLGFGSSRHSLVSHYKTDEAPRGDSNLIRATLISLVLSPPRANRLIRLGASRALRLWQCEHVNGRSPTSDGPSKATCNSNRSQNDLAHMQSITNRGRGICMAPKAPPLALACSSRQLRIRRMRGCVTANQNEPPCRCTAGQDTCATNEVDILPPLCRRRIYGVDRAIALASQCPGLHPTTIAPAEGEPDRMTKLRIGFSRVLIPHNKTLFFNRLSHMCCVLVSASWPLPSAHSIATELSVRNSYQH